MGRPKLTRAASYLCFPSASVVGFHFLLTVFLRVHSGLFKWSADKGICKCIIQRWPTLTQCPSKDLSTSLLCINARECPSVWDGMISCFDMIDPTPPLGSWNTVYADAAALPGTFGTDPSTRRTLETLGVFHSFLIAPRDEQCLQSGWQ
jgi:hypothetical protein